MMATGRTAKRQPARLVAQKRSGSSFWIDHAAISDADFEWLQAAERLTLWNVLVPDGFFARLPALWWLDLRGGSGVNLDRIRGAVNLRYLAVNQVRGMHDLSLAALLPRLQYLDLYGLSKVTNLPSFRSSPALEHAHLGQLRGLKSIGGVLEAPNLKQLDLDKKVGVSQDDLEQLSRHRSLEQFRWYSEGVPNSVADAAYRAANLPPVPIMFPEEWFRQRQDAR